MEIKWKYIYAKSFLIVWIATVYGACDRLEEEEKER